MGKTTAYEIAIEIRRRQPGISDSRLHKLLYYCQGHYAAAVGEALFPEPINAAPSGPVVDLEPGTPNRPELNNDELVTIVYVLGRYGRSTTHDLSLLTRAEPPWRNARAANGPTVSLDDMIAYFRGDGADDAGTEEIHLDRRTVRDFVTGALDESIGSGTPDNLGRLRERLVGDG